MSITEGLRVGDTVVHSRTMKVKFAQDGYVELHDVDNGLTRIGLFDGHAGSDKIEVVKKAKPQVGDVLTGDEIVDREWKPGTVIESIRHSGDIYVMQNDGRWAFSDSSGDASSIQHREMYGRWRGKLRHVA
jgi:hypothetical protein